MPNAVFVRHSVLFLPHHRPPPAIACVVVQHHRHLWPSPSTEVAVSRRSHRLQSAVSAVSRCCLSSP
jgi:hypothetical protein